MADLVVDQKWAEESWTLRKAMRTRRMWALFGAQFFLFGLGYYVVQSHQVLFAQDMGFSRMFAASVFGLTGVANAFGHATGFVSDRIGRERTMTVCTAGMMLGVALLLLIKDASQGSILYVSAISFGFFGGMASPTMVATTADLFRGGSYGTIQGFVIMGFAMAAAIAPSLAGFIHDYTGRYLVAFLLAIASIGFAGGLVWLAAPRKVRAVAGRTGPRPRS